MCLLLMVILGIDSVYCQWTRVVHVHTCCVYGHAVCVYACICMYVLYTYTRIFVNSCLEEVCDTIFQH